MPPYTVAVYSNRDDLAGRLRQSWTVLDSGEERDPCRIAVIDSDSHARLDVPPRKSLVRVILCEGAPPPNRKNGELRVQRDAFLRAPDEYLAFAVDLFEAVVHASQLE